MEDTTHPQEHTATPGVADGVSHELDRRWVTYRRQVGWILALALAVVMLGAVGGGVLLAGLPATPLVIGMVVAATTIAWLGQWWPALAYRYASYRLGSRALEIRRGVLWRRVIDVPRSRIQHSDVSQGPIERQHGLGTLSVYTAGTSHALVRLHGLEHQRALAIREHLMQADEDDVI